MCTLHSVTAARSELNEARVTDKQRTYNAPSRDLKLIYTYSIYSIYIVSPSVTTLPVYSYSCGPLLQDLSPWRRWPVWTSRSAAMVLPTGRRCLRVCAARWEGCLWTRGVTPPTTTPMSSSSRVCSSSGPSSCLCHWKSSRRCPSLPRGYVRSVDVSLPFRVGYEVDCC